MGVEVLTHAEGLHGSAQEIAGAVGSQAAASSQMSASVAQITSTMEELSASSRQIADHAQAVVEIASRTWDTSKAGSEAMGTVMQRMEEIRRDNQQGLTEILALGGKSKEIARVMELINAVADQTRLIAFNAALEAASAGESGRRFGVVAAEIRRLADSVTESTGEIEAKVDEIQESISRLVVSSEKGVGGIDAGMAASAHTAERLADLEAAARHTTSAAQQISLSTQQQRTASDQVVLALREIVTASAGTAASIHRISEVSGDMAGLALALRQIVRGLRLRNPADAGAAGEGGPPLPAPSAPVAAGH